MVLEEKRIVGLFVAGIPRRGSYGMSLQEVSLQTIWSWKTLKESQGNPTRNWRNPDRNYKMLEKSNPIPRDIWFFLEISPQALHTINSKSTEETGNAEGKLEFREHIKARKTGKIWKMERNWKHIQKTEKCLLQQQKKNNKKNRKHKKRKW